jgi:hypothetical protein
MKLGSWKVKWMEMESVGLMEMKWVRWKGLWMDLLREWKMERMKGMNLVDSLEKMKDLWKVDGMGTMKEVQTV